MQTRTLPARGVAGVKVHLDASVLALIALVIWAFSSVFGDHHPLPVAMAMAAATAVLVVATTLAHELGHALEARSRGLEVEGITLQLFGGVTQLHTGGQRPRDELAIALVGPWISLVCGAAFGLLATYADSLVGDQLAGPVGRVAGALGWWNVVLALFNLVPGAPLDGGRVLRALLWMALGDRLRALTISVRAGQLLGVSLIVLAAVALSRGGPRIVVLTAALAISGVFLIRAASSELRHARMHAALTGRRVGELLSDPPDGTTPAVPEHELPAALTATDGDLPSVTPDDDLHTMIDAFQGDHHHVRVVEDGRTVAILREREVARAVAALRRAVVRHTRVRGPGG